MSKKKILILLPVFDLGGAEKQGFYAAKELKETGSYITEVWAFNKSSGNLIKLIEEEGIAYKDLNISFTELNNSKKRLLLYFQFIRKLRKSNFYGILPFTYHANLITAFCFRFGGVKKALWFQIAMEHHIRVSRFEKFASRFKPIYASNSIAAGDFISKRHLLDNNQTVYFIPNPFEIKEVKLSREEWRRDLGIKDDEFAFGIVANFYHEKDHLTLLKAAKLLKDKGLKFKLILAGDNNRSDIYLLKLKAFILDSELYDVVKFSGVVQDVPGLLQCFDCGMLTSSTEGSPNALIEYVAYRRPVIVSDIKPNMEIVGDNYPYHFPVGNEVKLLEQMESIINRPKGIEKRMEELGEKTINKYSQEENQKAFISILEA